jgi:hypothetical protein
MFCQLCVCVGEQKIDESAKNFDIFEGEKSFIFTPFLVGEKLLTARV